MLLQVIVVGAQTGLRCDNRFRSVTGTRNAGIAGVLRNLLRHYFEKANPLFVDSSWCCYFGEGLVQSCDLPFLPAFNNDARLEVGCHWREGCQWMGSGLI